METQEIKIRVSPQAANTYQSASEEERSKLDLLLSLRLSEIEGLTEEILREILNEQ